MFTEEEKKCRNVIQNWNSKIPGLSHSNNLPHQELNMWERQETNILKIKLPWKTEGKEYIARDKTSCIELPMCKREIN